MWCRVVVFALFGLLSAGCSGSGAPDGGRDALALECATPQSIEMVVGTSGAPIAVIGWSGDVCTLSNDERAADGIVGIADLGSFGGSTPIVAVRLDDWVIERSPVSSSRTTTVTGLSRGEPIELVMSRDSVRVRLVVRVDGDTLTLLSMQLE
jgi:hypothetical protein